MIKSSGVHGILLTALAAASITSTAFATNYTITVDAKTKQGAVPHFWSRCVGTGGAQLCVDNDWKVAAKMGVKEAGFKAFRGHRILSFSNPISWNGSGTPTYNWTKFDQVYDFLVDSLGTEPIVELSSMPKDLETSGEWSPPKSMTIWQDLIKNVVSHCITRYGKERVSKWYWEVWNEWDYSGFWSGGTENQYYEMYKYAVLGATEAYPEIKIGGPSTTGAGNNRIKNFLNYCKTNNIKVDLVSNHNYGGGGSGPSADPIGILNDSRTRENEIKAFGKPLVSMNTEFSSSYSGQGGGTGANLISMDSHVNAPFVAKCVKVHFDDAQANRAPLPYVLSYWAVSDVFDESGAAGYIKGNGMVPFGGVFGLINYQGVPKATFNAYKMMHMMGNTRLSLVSSIASFDADGVDGFSTLDSTGSEVAILVYNFYKTLGGQTAVDNIALTVNNLPFENGKMSVTHFRVDSTHSNAYGVWLKNNKPKTPSTDVWNQMREAAKLALLKPVDTVNFAGAAYTNSFDLPRQGLSLILIKSLASTSIRNSQCIKMCHIAAMNSLRSGEELTYSIFSVDGKLIKSISTKSASFDIQKLSARRGVYLVRIEHEGKMLSSKFMRID